ncbi:hypothetical protein U27_06038 [Candidatus Vecturithrix granuli]|uniref:AB hydrolase-1 domain-containing protein n=1 Tax=Vecturithrix granuli TaxID=1499967 RepID=A0A081C3A7_VECG1|nr:hypothetical protein U27_06038 [Candidatus Vecturithrix granuli]
MSMNKVKLGGTWLLIFLMSGICGCALYQSFMPEPSSLSDGDYVILVHGLGRTWRSMKASQRFFVQQGYQVINLKYPSTKYPIETLSQDFLRPVIYERCIDQTKKIHFVTHSMGGILVRYYLRTEKPQNLGRVVMLAPPNQGSEVVDWEKHWWIFRRFLGPAGQQLGTDADSLPLRLGPINFELGVIAGNRSLEPFHSMMIQGPDDGKVAVERTKVAGMQDFLVLPHTHTFLMRNRDALQQAEYFLRTGKFQRTKEGKGNGAC